MLFINRREPGLLFASFFCISIIIHSKYILLSTPLYHMNEQKANVPLEWALPEPRLAKPAGQRQINVTAGPRAGRQGYTRHTRKRRSLFYKSRHNSRQGLEAFGRDFFSLEESLFLTCRPALSMPRDPPPHPLRPHSAPGWLRQGNRRDIAANQGLDATPQVPSIEAIVPLSNPTWCATHQPRRRLIYRNRHTVRHDALHHAPRVATAPHCQPDTTLHGSPQRHTVSQTPRTTGRHSATLSARHHAPRVALSFLWRLGGRLLSVDNLWITWGKPSSYPCQISHFGELSPFYPQVIHRLSTTYPQLKTSYGVRGLLT